MSDAMTTQASSVLNCNVCSCVRGLVRSRPLDRPASVSSSALVIAEFSNGIKKASHEKRLKKGLELNLRQILW